MASQSPSHCPVLKNEILDLLITNSTQTVFDGTLGLGGHAKAILERFDGIKSYLGCDLDPQHLALAKSNLVPWKDKVQCHQTNFSDFKDLITHETPRPLAVLLDLGICSNQLDDAQKGFSFAQDGPLVMAFNPKAQPNAENLINSSPQEQLVQIFKDYGEEPRAVKLANAITEARKQNHITTTGQLKDIIHDNTHPKDLKKTLTRTFQALRIAVNQELSHLEKFLTESMEVLKSGDRIGIISYHSLEDRIVKKFFNKCSKPITAETEYSLHEEIAPALGKCCPRKAIPPTKEEIEKNPRSRSARLRIFEKN